MELVAYFLFFNFPLHIEKKIEMKKLFNFPNRIKNINGHIFIFENL